MVGVTGIEPVTPTMLSQDRQRFNPDYITVIIIFFMENVADELASYPHYIGNRMIFGCRHVK